MRRTGPTVLLALVATGWLAACGTDEPGTVGQEPLAQVEEVDDRTISTRVQAGFYQNENVKTADIDVRTAGGVVTLDGTVPSEEVKQEALELARGVEGVVRVDDSLEVAGSGAAATKGEEQPGERSPSAAAGARTAERKQESGQPGEGGAGRELSAGWITAKIQGQYFADQDVKGRRIDVDTTNGVVTLAGEVDSERARRRAVEIAQQTEGVTRVDDQLRVVAAGASPAEGGGAAATTERPVEDEEITSRIQAKYFTNEEVRDSDIDVSSDDGVVTLKGTVDSEARRDEAVSIARNTAGVNSVKDELKVEAAAAGTAGAERSGGAEAAPGGTRSLGEKIDDGWITTKIQSKFFLEDRMRAADVNVTTKNGAVTLEGVVESAEAKRQAVQMAENTDGVTRVIDRLKVQPQGEQKSPQEKQPQEK